MRRNHNVNISKWIGDKYLDHHSHLSFCSSAPSQASVKQPGRRQGVMWILCQRMRTAWWTGGRSAGWIVLLRSGKQNKTKSLNRTEPFCWVSSCWVSDSVLPLHPPGHVPAGGRVDSLWPVRCLLGYVHVEGVCWCHHTLTSHLTNVFVSDWSRKSFHEETVIVDIKLFSFSWIRDCFSSHCWKIEVTCVTRDGSDANGC